jgi:NAD(P)H-dependent FMN reductase
MAFWDERFATPFIWILGIPMTTHETPRIGMIIGSTRDARFGEKPARWIYDIASHHADLAVELIDLRDHPLSYFNEAMPPLYQPPANEAAQRWGAKLAALDGLIVVTPEYNHGYPAALKNAFDVAYKEFVRKPIAFVGYGGVGAARAIEQLRMVTIELQMAPLRYAVHIGMVEFLGIWQQGKSFGDFPHLEQSAKDMLDDMAWWAHVLKAARNSPA